MNENDQNPSVNLSLSEVARGVGISPQNLHKTYIKKGKISVSRSETGKPFIPLVEVLRVFGSQFMAHDSVEEAETVETKPVEEKVAKVKTVDSKKTVSLNQSPDLLAKISDLERQLREAKDHLHSSEKREEWLMGQVDKLSDTIKLIGHTKAPESPANSEKTPWWRYKIF